MWFAERIPFTFPEFIFIGGKSRRGAFQPQRKTRGDRMRARLQEVKTRLRERMHDTIPEQGKWLRAVVTVTGYFAYHAVPTNSRALGADITHRSLAAHAQATRPEGRDDVGAYDEDCCVLAAATSNPASMAGQAVCRQPPTVGAECANCACSDLCGGAQHWASLLRFRTGSPGGSYCALVEKARVDQFIDCPAPEVCGCS